MPRVNTYARLRVADLKFNMEMLVNDWGPEDPILDQILHNRFDEHQSILWWLYFVRTCPVSPCVLDVGAYTGLFSIIAAKARPDACVVAYEPSAATWGRLARNVQLNLCEAQVLAANLAAWDKRSHAVFNHPYGIYTLCPGESVLANQSVEFSQSVACAPLDDILEERSNRGDYINSASYAFLPPKKVCAVKIDVEGAEPGVLNGAHRVIAEHRPYFIVEALEPQAESELIDFFSKYSYGFIPLREERNLIFMPSDKLADIKIDFDSWKNRHAGDQLVHGSTVHSYTVSEF